MFPIRYIPKLIVFVVISWMSWYAYTYFLDTTHPNVVICGINENEYYCNDINYCVQSNKNGAISLWLDNQPFINILSHKYEFFSESKNSNIYECFLPIECEQQPNEYLFTIEIEDKVGNIVRLDNKFQVLLFQFKKEILTVTADKVKEEKLLGK